MSKKSKILLVFFSILLLGLVAFLVYPSPVDPEAYTPPPVPSLEGKLSPNDKLQSSEILGEGEVKGPEAIAIGHDGLIYTGTDDGWILRIYPDGTIEKFAETGGRPLGLKFHPSGDLYVCDSKRGLLKIDSEGKMEILSIESDNTTFRFTNDLDISSDGIIYFTDASNKFGVHDYLFDIFESKGHGRLLQFDPKTRRTSTLVDGLFFANGVALSSDETYLLVAETTRYRIMRYWLEGENKGTWEVFLANLPGFPDNITSNRNGKFYIALYTLRNPLLDLVQPYPIMLKSLAKLPRILWPKPQNYGFVMVVDEDGEILDSFQDTTGKKVRHITSAVESEGYLYMGTLLEKRIAKYKLE